MHFQSNNRGSDAPALGRFPRRGRNSGADIWERSSNVLGFLGTYCLVINSLAGTFAALSFLVFSAIVCSLNIPKTVIGMKVVWPFLILPGLALASTVWSVAPSITLRSSLQLLLTAIFAVGVIQSCSRRWIITAFALGYFTVVVNAVPDLWESLSSGQPLRGLFESKNAFGVHAQMLSFFCVAMLFNISVIWVWRILALLVLILAMALTLASKSGSAMLLAVIPLFIFPLFMALAKLGRGARFSVLLLVLVFSIVLVPAAQRIENEISIFRQDVLGKDATLTGRTELWATAKTLEAERPLLGLGFNAFWRQGNPDAEALWRKFGIASRSGFNFHNEFVEIRVELGSIAVVILFGCFGLFIYHIASSFISVGDTRSYNLAFSACVFMIFALRSSVEVFLYSQFSVSLFIFLFAYLLIRESPEGLSSQPASRVYKSDKFRNSYRKSRSVI